MPYHELVTVRGGMGSKLWSLQAVTHSYVIEGKALSYPLRAERSITV